MAEIKNPQLAPISLNLSLAPCPASVADWKPEPVASLGVFPPDQSGTYSVSVTAALARNFRRVENARSRTMWKSYWLLLHGRVKGRVTRGR
jgi:hypothetical protein